MHLVYQRGYFKFNNIRSTFGGRLRPRQVTPVSVTVGAEVALAIQFIWIDAIYQYYLPYTFDHFP
jgi:hypothetical protein